MHFKKPHRLLCACWIILFNIRFICRFIHAAYTIYVGVWLCVFVQFKIKLIQIEITGQLYIFIHIVWFHSFICEKMLLSLSFNFSLNSISMHAVHWNWHLLAFNHSQLMFKFMFTTKIWRQRGGKNLKTGQTVINFAFFCKQSKQNRN